MVGTQDFGQDECFPQGWSQVIRDDKVINAPAHVSLPGPGTVGPPGVGGGDVRMEVTESVDEPGLEQAGHSSAFLGGEARVLAVAPGIG